MESAENEKVELVLRIIPASAKGLVEEWFHEVGRIGQPTGSQTWSEAFIRFLDQEKKNMSHHDEWSI
ncbi:hypothetical protein ABFV05_004105 [Capra hircus]